MARAATALRTLCSPASPWPRRNSPSGWPSRASWKLQPSARDERDQARERGLHRLQVGVDVGVVELEVADDGHVRVVVDELGPLVEERGVVLVALHHEVAPLAEMIAAGEVAGHAADEIR